MMNTAFFRVLAFECLRYATMAYTTLRGLWNNLVDWYYYTPLVQPSRRYFLSNMYTFNDAYFKVPDDTVYVEEWIKNGETKCVVRYPNEVIPASWIRTPFEQHARCPWVWVGDKDTELDLTRTFTKFVVPGNQIRSDLVNHLVHPSNLIYIEAGTFRELKFPGEGLLIKANGDE
jgi:hypothetical protein